MKSLQIMAARCWWLALMLGAGSWAEGAHAAVMRHHAGRLQTASGAAVRGPVDLEVLLYRRAEGGDPLLPAPLSFASVPLEDGRFRLRLELSDADSVVVFGARGDATVWVQVLDQSNDRVYPRQKMTEAAEVVTAVTPQVEPGTGTMPRPGPPTATASSTASEISSSAPATATTTSAEASEAMVSTATAAALAASPTDGQLSTSPATETLTDFRMSTSTATQAATDPHMPPSPAAEALGTATAETPTPNPDEPLELGLPAATFIESPLGLEPMAGRLELGTAGRCGEVKSASASGDVAFAQAFAAPPRVFLEAGDDEGAGCAPRVAGRSIEGFRWSSGGGLAGFGACACFHWMAVGR